MYRDYISELNIKPEQILVYLRKSRADDPLLTVEEVLSKHETILNEWAERNLSNSIPEDNRYREVVSGETIADRPEIQKILKFIESPWIKAILTVEVQRLSRGDLEDAGRLIKLLRYTNTLVITPHKIYDLADEYDRDAFERELKRGNEFLEYQKKIMNRGRLLSVSQGNFVGSIPPYGYDKSWIMEGKRKCPVLVINEEQANVVRMIFDLFVNHDMGINNICNKLDAMCIKPCKGDYWSPHAVREMISNVHYIGKVKWNFRKTVKVVEDSEIVEMRPKSKMGDFLIYDGKHDPIISEEIFDLAQEKKGRGVRVPKKNTVRNPLAGLLYCSCGRTMTLRTYKDKSGNERCAPRLMCENQIHCHTGSCLYDEMIDYVKTSLRENIWDIKKQLKDNKAGSIKLQEKMIATLEKKLRDIEDRELAQWEAQANPDPSQRMPVEIFKKLNDKLQREKAEATEALRIAKENIPARAEQESMLIKLQDALDALADPKVDPKQKNILLKACIERITYKRERPTRLERSSKERDKVPPQLAGISWTSPPMEIDIQMKIRSKA